MEQIDVAGFAKLQFRNGKFNRYDIFVRILALDSFYGKNDFGWKIYRKQEKARTKLPDQRIDEFVEAYKSLIKSFAEKGFDKQYPITYFGEKQLFNGAHRFACSIFFKEKSVPIEKLDVKTDVHYGRHWFETYGFTTEEMRRIEDKKSEIFAQLGIKE